jgi:hypothetical protein
MKKTVAPPRLWMIVPLGMLGMYFASPLWPHAVAPLEWRWYAAPVFFVVASIACFYVSRNNGWFPPLLATGVLAFYCFLEGLVGAVLYYLFAKHIMHPVVLYLYIGLLNLLNQLPAIFLFFLFCILRLAVEKWGQVRRETGKE